MSPSARLRRLANKLDRLAWMAEQYNELAMQPAVDRIEAHLLIANTRAAAQRLRRRARTLTTKTNHHRN